MTPEEFDRIHAGDWSSHPAPSWLDWFPPWALGMIFAACAAATGSLLIWLVIECIRWLAGVL